jgi:hypothetical protein
MPTFKDPKKLAAHIKKALDFQMAETLITTQARLGSASVSPVDTGRLRSSWFAAEGNASNAEAPEGANSPSTDATGLRVDSRKNYHLTNNLPYAQRVALEGHVVSKPTNWFVDFVNSDVPKIQAEAAQQAKREFDL